MLSFASFRRVRIGLAWSARSTCVSERYCEIGKNEKIVELWIMKSNSCENVGAGAKIFHVTNIQKSSRRLSYVIQIENKGLVEDRVPFRLDFNKDVKIYNSTILYMFESMFDAPQNRKIKWKYELVVDLEPDVDIADLRSGYSNLLLADGTGLDSHAIRLLADGCRSLRYATLVDLKAAEIESIDRSEYDTDDSVLITGENYLRHRSMQDVRLDFTHDGNRLYLLMLLIDHFQAYKVMTGDTEKLAVKSFFGKTTDLYTCNFLYGDIGTAYVNAILDPARYFDRLLKCGFFPHFKNLRKYLTAKYLEVRYGVRIFTPELEKLFLEVNRIDIAGKHNFLEILDSYKKQKMVSTGLQLFDVYVITLSAIDESELRRTFVHSPEQDRVFDGVMRLVREEYAASRLELEGVRLFDFSRLRQAFGDAKSASFYETVRRKMMKILKEGDHTPKFSFILPTYNRAFCIKRAIDSLLEQTTGNFELIIVDDGSTDGTETLVAETYAGELAQGLVRYVKTANGGVCKARNVGLSHARGEWIAYLDSDNEIVPDFVATMEKAIVEHPKTEAFYAKLEFMESKRVIGRPFDFEALRFHNFIDLGTYVHRRALCEEEGVFDEKMTRLVDWELIVRYSSRHTPVFVDKIVLKYDDSKDTNRITNLGRSSYYSNLNYLRRKHCSDYPLVTTIVTTYNHECFISQALDSAVAQEGRFIHEILVSDDCSTDGTHDIVRAYAEKNPGLVFDISEGRNLGISGNMHKCFERASGKYIAVLEGDDYWVSSKKLAKQVDFLEENRDCSMVFSRVKVLQNGAVRSLSRHANLPTKLTGRDFFSAETLSLLVNFSCCMFRAEPLHDMPTILYENRLSEISLAFYLETKGYIGYIPEMLSVYRVHSAGEWSGASVIGKRLQERFCRVVARMVCRPEYRAEFSRLVSGIDANILARERELESRCNAEHTKSVQGERRLAAAVKKASDCEKRIVRYRRLEESLKREIVALKQSTSYRVGLFVTWPLRKVWRGFKCLRENGVKYTVKHSAGKVMRLFGSKVGW